MPKKVTVKEYAKNRGITERSVRRQIAEGLIPETAQIREGRFLFIDQVKADRALSKHGTTRKELLGSGILPPPSKAAPVQQIQTAERAGTSGLSFHEARTLKERYSAAILKISLDEKTGRLVDSEQVKVAAFNRARAVRDAILNIPDRISPILAAETDQNKVAELLRFEIRQALEELSR